MRMVEKSGILDRIVREELAETSRDASYDLEKDFIHIF